MRECRSGQTGYAQESSLFKERDLGEKTPHKKRSGLVPTKVRTLPPAFKIKMVYKEWKKKDFMSYLKITEKQIPKYLIIEGTWETEERLKAFKKYIKNSFSPRGFFGRYCILGEFQKTPIAYSVIYGPSLASEIVHTFSVLGIKAAIQIGSFGALQKGMKVGEMLIPTFSEKKEGAANFYFRGKADSSKRLDKILLKICEERGIKGYNKKMLSVAAMLAETKELIKKWNKKGYFGVDLETATTFAVAKHFRVERCALLRMIDNVIESKHVESPLSIEEKIQKERSKKELIEIPLELIKRLETKKSNLIF